MDANKSLQTLVPVAQVAYWKRIEAEYLRLLEQLEEQAGCYHRTMDDYFSSFAATINALDPKAADFEFLHANLRNAVQISGLLTDEQKKQLRAMLHIVQVQK